MACETLIFRKHFTHHGKIRLIYSVAGHAYGPAHGARLVQLTVGTAKEQTPRECRKLTGFLLAWLCMWRHVEHAVRLNGLLVTFHESVILQLLDAVHNSRKVDWRVRSR